MAKKPTELNTDTVYALKITIDYLKPAIWRRVEVPDCTLFDLHDIIQACMPWDDSHLWEFSITRTERYGPGFDDDLGFGDEAEPADGIKLSDLARRKIKKLRYLYDFGDSWDHIITFEKQVARDAKASYLRCVAGKRACPPDDCGGFPGYIRLLETLADPKDPEYESMLEWAGGPIDPEAFDIEAINKQLRKLKIKER